jgi:FkbM family methyltransferase
MECRPNGSALIPLWGGCPAAPWQKYAAEDPAIVARYPSPVLVNVGANKGYAAAEFLAIWSQRRVNSKIWLANILAYAGVKSTVHGYLRYQPCGECLACKVPTPAPHQRNGGSVHMLELLESNRALLRNLTRQTGIDDIATVHDMAAANETRRVYAPPFHAGFEARSAFYGTTEKPANLDAVALDDFFKRTALEEAYLVSIDTEGWDALVLEGMRGLLARGRIGFVEFEVGRKKAYWKPSHPERRVLSSTIGWLHAAGYVCFMEAHTFLAPISGACWRKEYELPRWANVLCANSRTPALDVLWRVARLADAAEIARALARVRCKGKKGALC